ncbi:hypothetical protein FRB98_001936, partial [Tulasnella sp. 332]
PKHGPAFIETVITTFFPFKALSSIDRSAGALAIITAPNRELANQAPDVLKLSDECVCPPKSPSAIN